MATYDECVNAWERSRLAMGEVEEHTARKSAQDARRLSPWIGGKQVEEITASDIEAAIVSLKKFGGKHGIGLSATTLRKSHMHGQAAVKWAVLHDMAVVNPFERAARPKGRQPEAESLDSGQAARLYEDTLCELNSCMYGRITPMKVKDAACCMFVLLALATGARRGELLALTWENVGESSISIKKAIKADGHIGEPKTRKGLRVVSVGSSTVALLAAYRNWQSLYIDNANEVGSYVLAVGGGKPLSGNVLEHWWSGFRADVGLDGFKIHGLRHTHATLLLANGEDVKTIQTRLGHSSAVMTLDVYSHAIPAKDVGAANLIERELGLEETRLV